MAVANDRLVPASPAHCLTAALDSGPRLSAPGRSWFLPAPGSRRQGRFWRVAKARLIQPLALGCPRLLAIPLAAMVISSTKGAIP